MSKPLIAIIVTATLFVTSGCQHQSQASDHATKYTATEFRAKGKPYYPSSVRPVMHLWVDVAVRKAVTESQTSMMGQNVARFVSYEATQSGDQMHLTPTGEVLGVSYATLSDMRAHKDPLVYQYVPANTVGRQIAITFKPQAKFEVPVSDASIAKFEKTDSDVQLRPLTSWLSDLKKAGVTELSSRSK